MKKRIILSVIVPVYNIEKYLRECIDSILTQDIAEMEVILVDDGSTDASGTICDEYAEKDGRVTVVHKENGGVSTARNAGLDIARGKYVTFVDSDDYLLPNTFRPNIEYMEGHQEVDCLQFPVYPDKRTNYFKACKRQTKEKTIEGINVFRNWWDGAVIHYSVWSKIFKTSVFHELRFPLGAFAEDAMIVPELSQRCKCVFLSMKGGYYYRYTEGSLLNSTWTEKKYMDFLKYRLLIWERVEEQEELKSVAIAAYLRALIILAWCTKKGFVNYGDYDTFLDSMPSIRLLPTSRHLTFKRIVGYIVIKIIGTRGFLRLYGKV